jgi:hypothetical protein
LALIGDFADKKQSQSFGKLRTYLQRQKTESRNQKPEEKNKKQTQFQIGQIDISSIMTSKYEKYWDFRG